MGQDMELRKCTVCNGFYSVSSFTKCPSCGSDSSFAEGVVEGNKAKAKSIFEIFKNGKKSQKDESIKEVSKEDSKSEKEELVKANSKNENYTETEKKEEDEYVELRPITPNSKIMKKPEIENASRKPQGNEMKTVQLYNIKKEPVVGWLVCVKGECMGASFEIRVGNNKLGRSLQSDICIEDNTISREQAVIKFEPRKQNFYLIPIDNAKFMYKDGEEIMERIILEPYVHLEIGDKTEFVFVPFCGERFDWKDYVEE